VCLSHSELDDVPDAQLLPVLAAAASLHVAFHAVSQQ